MTDTTQQPMSYAQELEYRLEELIEWAIANTPNKTSQLDKQDFMQLREDFCTIAKGGAIINNATVNASDALAKEPEPSQGGAQYINVNPAPWP